MVVHAHELGGENGSQAMVAFYEQRILIVFTAGAVTEIGRAEQHPLPAE